MKKIISFSLYGNNKKYTINSLVNLELCEKFYPDWNVFFHYDDTVPAYIINEMKKFSNCTLIKKEGIHHDRMWWRLFGYDYGDLFISRDADSHITEKVVAAVEDWLDSDKNMHIMRDHIGHYNKIQGGMFGIKKNDKIPSMKNIIENQINRSRNYGDDEDFLSKNIYPLFVGDMVVHDSFSRPWGNDKTHEWRVHLPEDQFIGNPQEYSRSMNLNIVEKYYNLQEELNG